MDGAVASTTFRVRTPRAIQHDGSGETTAVIALPYGEQNPVAGVENRGEPHSDLQPTGRWVQKGDVLTVNVVDATPTWWLQLGIGARGPWKVFNDGDDVGVPTVALHGGVNTITAERDGIVYVVNHSEWSAVQLTISGGRPHPVWEKGATTAEDFAHQMSAFASAPSVSFVGDLVFADVQRAVLEEPSVSSAFDPAALVVWMDQVRAFTDDVYGLSFDAAGVGRKHAGRVHISGPDSGVAYAFATSQWLSFHVSSGASRNLVLRKDLWGLAHEIGHTYQTGAYTWTGLTEVTVNISTLAVQERMTNTNMLDESPGLQNDITTYRSQPIENRHFADLVNKSPFLPLFAFDQLRHAFGEGFYPALSQAYRVRRALGQPMPASDAEMIDALAQTGSKVAQRDLSTFFAEWGLDLSESVRVGCSSYPPLEHAPWSWTVSSQARRERAVPYDLPVGTIATDVVAIELGNTDGRDVSVGGLRTLAGNASRVVSTGSVAQRVGDGAGTVFALIEAPDGTQDALTRIVSVTSKSALEFIGFYDVWIGWIGISRDGRRLVATDLGNPAHPYYFAGKTYYRVELMDASGALVAEATVRGEDTAAPVVAALDGVACAEGYRLVVRAAEPGRVRRYREGSLTGTLSSDPQTLTIRDGRFVDDTDPAV